MDIYTATIGKSQLSELALRGYTLALYTSQIFLSFPQMLAKRKSQGSLENNGLKV